MNLTIIKENSEEEVNKSIEITTNLPVLIIKSRIVGYEIPKQGINFVVFFYFMHGPIDKENFSC